MLHRIGGGDSCQEEEEGDYDNTWCIRGRRAYHCRTKSKEEGMIVKRKMNQRLC